MNRLAYIKKKLLMQKLPISTKKKAELQNSNFFYIKSL